VPDAPAGGARATREELATDHARVRRGMFAFTHLSVFTHRSRVVERRPVLEMTTV